MEPSDPPPPSAEDPREVLRRLEERLGRASDAAERLMAEAARSAVSGSSSSERRKAGNPDSAAEGEPPSHEPETERSGAAGQDEPPAPEPEPERRRSGGQSDPPTAGQRVKPPPAGWEAPQSGPSSGPRSARDIEVLVQAVQYLRELVPPEVQQRLLEALRELLLAIRALIDWYLERLERRRGERVEVQDIPIR